MHKAALKAGMGSQSEKKRFVLVCLWMLWQRVLAPGECFEVASCFVFVHELHSPLHGQLSRKVGVATAGFGECPICSFPNWKASKLSCLQLCHHLASKVPVSF